MQYKVDQAIEILERTPAILKVYLNGLSEAWTHCNEGEHSWSAYDIVGHLIHGEKTDWIPRLTLAISKGDVKTFTPFDRFAQFQASKGKTLEQLLDEFQHLRTENLNSLRALNLTKTDLRKKAIHPELGEVSVKNLLATWVTHDLGHIAQIARVMAKQYKEEVGPWTAYIPILSK